jgi:hypothetical protein
VGNSHWRRFVPRPIADKSNISNTARGAAPVAIS